MYARVLGCKRLRGIGEAVLENKSINCILRKQVGPPDAHNKLNSIICSIQRDSHIVFFSGLCNVVDNVLRCDRFVYMLTYLAM